MDMDPVITLPDFGARLRAAVSLAWRIFQSKVSGGVVSINKEASMQLHYAYILRQLLPLLQFKQNESAEIELETSCNVEGRPRLIDLRLRGEDAAGESHTIAIEMKCYRRLAASGKPRGATDIFMKDVYMDLHLLEKYCEAGIADAAVFLCMTDHKYFISRGESDAKCWDYDISDGRNIGPTTLSTPVGGRDVLVDIRREYSFRWQQAEGFWFMELEGVV